MAIKNNNIWILIAVVSLLLVGMLAQERFQLFSTLPAGQYNSNNDCSFITNADYRGDEDTSDYKGSTWILVDRDGDGRLGLYEGTGSTGSTGNIFKDLELITLTPGNLLVVKDEVPYPRFAQGIRVGFGGEAVNYLEVLENRDLILDASPETYIGSCNDLRGANQDNELDTQDSPYSLTSPSDVGDISEEYEDIVVTSPTGQTTTISVTPDTTTTTVTDSDGDVVETTVDNTEIPAGTSGDKDPFDYRSPVFLMLAVVLVLLLIVALKK